MYRKSRAQLVTPMTAKRFWEELKHRIPVKVHRSLYEVDDESGAKVLRSDKLAKAFQDGDPSFRYVERPECAAFKPSDK